MKLSIKPVQPCTIKSTPHFTLFRCCTITQPATSKSNINLNQTLKNLEHLLFVSGSEHQTVAPLGSLDHRWMEYQGIKNWEGLLDPLDGNLRNEIIRYGNFVEAAYRSCDFDPSSSSYAKCLYSKRMLLNRSGFSKTGYRVTRNLIATSGIQMPRCIEKVPSWTTLRSSWIGYVAVCHDKREIARLGRRDVVIAFRGTATTLEWLENLRATLTPITNNHSNNCPMVESGFLSLYKSSCGTRASLQNLVRKEISKILEVYGDEPLSITITGHSLGAALATLTAFDIKETFQNAPLVTVVSFGGPRVGNTSFRCHLENQGTKILRIVNSDDVITKVPGFIIENNHHNTMKNNHEHNHYTTNFSSWVQKRIEDTRWVYADIGCELRLSSKDSPYLNGINIATCHDLKTCLHLVNGFVSSECPFRATARKIMKKNIV